MQALSALVEATSHRTCLAACTIKGNTDRLASAGMSDGPICTSGWAPFLRIFLALALALAFALLWLLLMLLLSQLLWKLTLCTTLLLLLVLLLWNVSTCRRVLSSSRRRRRAALRHGHQEERYPRVGHKVCDQRV